MTPYRWFGTHSNGSPYTFIPNFMKIGNSLNRPWANIRVEHIQDAMHHWFSYMYAPSELNNVNVSNIGERGLQVICSWFYINASSPVSKQLISVMVRSWYHRFYLYYDCNVLYCKFSQRLMIKQNPQKRIWLNKAHSLRVEQIMSNTILKLNYIHIYYECSNSNKSDKNIFLFKSF